MLNLRTISTACLLPTLLLALAGCHGHASPASIEQAHLEQQAELETQREQLDMIPLPTKSGYMTIRTFDSWANPVLVAQPNVLELHVTLADANTTPIGAGGMFRPIGARRQELTISMDKLGEAITAVPQTSWPYGRVIAIEEANKIPASEQPAVRRNMETAITRLNALNVVVYDLNDGGKQ